MSLQPINPQIETVVARIPYAPRGLFMPLHERDKRWAACVAHRRAGKTVACINDLIKAAWECKLDQPRFAYVAPTYGQAKDVAWGYLKQYALAIPGTEANETELRVDLPNGGRVRLYGADNYDRLRGIYLDGIVLDEYGDMEPRAWEEVIRPALSDRRGWAIFIGTPRGRNHFAELWDRAQVDEDWVSLRLPASQTGVLPKDELADARRMMTREQYDAEYECSFSAPVVGSYYGADIEEAEKAGRITKVPHDRGTQVHTAWDLGIGDSTAIWLWQAAGQELHIVDYIENAGVGLDWYVREVTSRGYVLGKHVLPHDAQARELGTGKTIEEVLRTLGIEPTICPRHRVEDGVNASRMMLPRCYFDAEKTKKGVDALRHYRREWDAKRKVFKDLPLHDWASHGADAFRYLAMGFGLASVKSKPLRYDMKWVV